VPTSHASPFWPQYDDDAQTPLLQRPEQQSPVVAHGLPSVRHELFRAEHTPPLHVPLQQLAGDEHAELSARHVGISHSPLVHVPEQQSASTEHMLPFVRHPGVRMASGEPLSTEVVDPSTPGKPESLPVPAASMPALAPSMSVVVASTPLLIASMPTLVASGPKPSTPGASSRPAPSVAWPSLPIPTWSDAEPSVSCVL
jgi:hypothetical protein